MLSTDWTGVSGLTLSSLMTKASSVEGVNATTDVVVEDLGDEAWLERTGDEIWI